MTDQDILTGFLVGQMLKAPAIDSLTLVITLIGITVVIVIGLILCWDLGQQSLSDLAKVGWVIILFILPVLSWIAYWIVIRKG
ncbi:MAG: hypothetical protein ACTSO9_18155 [Candidatus Helarchaeota archaeon]